MGLPMLSQERVGSAPTTAKSWPGSTVDSTLAMDRQTPDPILTAHEAIGRAGPMLGSRPVLVTSDFDGTLSVPQMDPWAATVLPQAQRALRRLAAMDGVYVALLSGRTATDLSARVRVGGADYLGNQGLERGRLGRRQPARTMVVVPQARLLAREVPRSVQAPWLVVEGKGPAVTFHYRGAPDVAAAGSQVAHAVDLLDPHGALVRFPGRRSLELRPRGAPAKGEAFRTLLDDVRPAVAVGAGQVAREETGPHADITLGSPADAARFLDLLAHALGPRTRQPS